MIQSTLNEFPYKSLLIGMLACTALVGCTNEELIDDPINNQEENNEKAVSYVRVKLVMADSNGSRAANDGGYNVGEIYEQNIDVNKSIFLFYDAAGDYVTAGSLVDNTLNKNENGTHHTTTDINSVYGDKFIALSASEDAVKKITQVLTVVNYHDINSLKNKPLDEVKKLTTTEEQNVSNAGNTEEQRDTDGNVTTAGSGYLMSTSVYHDGTDWVETTAILGNDVKAADGTVVTHANIQPTQTLAYEYPIKIYIERAAAKVQLKSGNNDGSWTFAVEPDSENEEKDPNTEADIVVDNVLTPVSVKITGWTINNYNTTTNLVKRFNADWNTNVPYTGWNFADDHRSYWALDTEYTYLGSPTIKNITDHNAHLATKSFNQVQEMSTGTTTKDNVMYCYEHAKAQGADNVDENRTAPVNYPNVTTVLIAGEVLLPNATSGETLYKYNSIYYREAAYKSMVASFLRQYTDAATNGNILEENDWTITLAEKEEGEDFEFSIKVELANAAKSIYLSGESVSIDNVNKAVENKFVKTTEETKDAEGNETTIHTEVLTDGKCFYQIPIEHLSSSATAPLYGVIRNHWYQLKIKAIAHVGEPVGDPEKPLPEIPTKETAHYLAAEIHVLSWHVVEQDVTLE